MLEQANPEHTQFMTHFANNGLHDGVESSLWSVQVSGCFLSTDHVGELLAVAGEVQNVSIAERPGAGARGTRVLQLLRGHHDERHSKLLQE